MAFVMNFLGDDFLYDTVDIAIWSDIEQGLAITAGSLATLRPLYRILAKNLGFAQPASKLPSSQHNCRGWHQSASNRPKRNGPFSLISMTRNNTQYGADADDDFALQNARPVKLKDNAAALGAQEKSFSSWTVQGGENEDWESLDRGDEGGGIMRKTDVFLERSGRV
jgi:hypothetical protein